MEGKTVIELLGNELNIVFNGDGSGFGIELQLDNPDGCCMVIRTLGFIADFLSNI